MEQAIAKGRFALDDWNRIRSNQYSISQTVKDMITTRRAHVFLVQIPNRRTLPAAAQTAPVMDRYNGLRLDPNSNSSSHARKAATNRVAPHIDNINTIHRSRVTPKGLRNGMDYFLRDRIRLKVGMKRRSCHS
ncbi:MAG TPA: hypothetical protein DCX53_14005 [Anaerolineae bacterium]|nr:hypothetical protein [Anaerolineae bacterium]